MRKQKIIIIGVVAALVTLYAVANHFWLKEGASLYGRDVVGHLQLVVKFYYQAKDILQSTPPAPALLVKILALFHEESLPIHHTYIWPKLVHIGATAACFIFGLSPYVMIQFNILFFAILIISTYLIGTRCQSPKAGLFAAVLVSLYPAVYGTSRKFGLDFPLTAMTALAVYFLLRTEYFQRRGYSILLGIAFGLGILTKGQILLYLAFPIMWCLIAPVVTSKSFKSSRWWNVLIFVVISLSISALWWWGIVGDLWRAYFATVTDYPFSWAYSYKHQPPFTARWLFFHAIHCAISTSPFFFVIFLASILGFLRSRFQGKAVLLLWLFGAYAIWTISNIKRDTDFFPCLPAVALVTATGIMSWKTTFLKKSVVAGSIIVGLLQFFCLSFSSTGYNLWNVENPYNKPMDSDGYNTPFHPPYPNNYKAVMDQFSDEILSREATSKYIKIGIVETTGPGRWPEYNMAILEYYFRLRDPCSFIYRSRYTPEAFLQHAFSFDYLIVMDRRNGNTPDWGELESFYSDKRFNKAVIDYFGSYKAFRELIESYRNYPILERGTLLPGKCGVYLCKKGPIQVSSGAEIPASCYSLSNLTTIPLMIGAINVPRHAPKIPEYDLFFPYWLRFPLVDDDLRYPGDPFFCEYQLEFSEEGTYQLSVRYASDGGERIYLFWDEELVSDNVLRDSTGGLDEEYFIWKQIASLSASSGRHKLRLVGKKDFPLLAAIKFDKL